MCHYSDGPQALPTIYSKKHKILHISEGGFRPQRNTTRQIQTIIVASEDAKHTHILTLKTLLALMECRLSQRCTGTNR